MTIAGDATPGSLVDAVVTGVSNGRLTGAQAARDAA
jgi:hypothetical protein